MTKLSELSEVFRVFVNEKLEDWSLYFMKIAKLTDEERAELPLIIAKNIAKTIREKFPTMRVEGHRTHINQATLIYDYRPTNAKANKAKVVISKGSTEYRYSSFHNIAESDDTLYSIYLKSYSLKGVKVESARFWQYRKQVNIVENDSINVLEAVGLEVAKMLSDNYHFPPTNNDQKKTKPLTYTASFNV